MSTEIYSVLFTHEEDTNTTKNPNINNSIYFQHSSQAEHAITQYKEDSIVDTKGDPKSGIKYPYEKIINFVSNFPYGFRACFVPGKGYHYRRFDLTKEKWSRYDYEKNKKNSLNL